MTLPLLLIDVDGPLNPYASSNRQHRRNKIYREYRLNGFRVWLNRAHGEQFLALADLFELTWCTTWEHDANSMIGPRIGLPELPVVEFDKQRIGSDDGTYFKTHEIVTSVAGRPFAWIDDEITDIDREYVAAHHNGPALLHHVDPRLGLLPDDFAALAEWANSLTATS
ncbi:hypothetical protein [Streptomyces sp. NPDC008150]|uniref:hypothetical protein n=1 Tax=Streptomyces sp. NPDC008150 TaxID=3364816 RepID=UPI0036E79C14